MKIGANYGEFRLLPEGNNILKVLSVKLVPSGKPKEIEVVLVSQDKIKITNNYNINHDGAMFAFSMLYKFAVGSTPNEFDSATLEKEMVDNYVVCEIVHSKGSKKTEEGEDVYFANIKKVLEGAEGFDTKSVNDKVDAVLEDEEDDEELSLEDDDEDEDDLPFL